MIYFAVSHHRSSPGRAAQDSATGEEIQSHPFPEPIAAELPHDDFPRMKDPDRALKAVETARALGHLQSGWTQQERQTVIAQVSQLDKWYKNTSFPRSSGRSILMLPDTTIGIDRTYSPARMSSSPAGIVVRVQTRSISSTNFDSN